MSAYRQILAQPLLQWPRQWHSLAGLLLAGCVALGLLLKLTTESWRLVGLGCTGVLFAVLVAAWIPFLQNAVLQGAPAQACLVPGLRQRLIRLTAVVWLGFSLLVGVPAALLSDVPLLALNIAGSIFLFIMAIQRRPMLGFVPGPLIFSFNWLGGDLGVPVRWLQHHQALGGGCWLLLIFVLLPLSLRELYPQGSAGHWRLQLRMRQRAESLRTGLPPRAEATGPRWLTLRLDQMPGMDALYGYAASLKRACARRAAGGRLAMLGLGPGVYWSKTGVAVLSIVILAAILLLLPDSPMRRNPALAFLGPNFTMLFALIVQIAWAHSAANAIHTTPVEQGLLRLAPRAPQAPAINRMLGQALLRRFYGLWLLSTASALAIALALCHMAIDIGYALSMASLSLPLGAALLRQYARREVLDNQAIVAPTLMVMLPLWLAYAALRHWLLPLPWPLLGLACVAGSALLLPGRWRTMMAGAPAFPAGRIG